MQTNMWVCILTWIATHANCHFNGAFSALSKGLSIAPATQCKSKFQRRFSSLNSAHFV